MWDWAIATIYISLLIGAIVIGANLIRLCWWPLCPKCACRGYRHVCDVGPGFQEVDETLWNDAGSFFEIRRCRHCRVYRINGPNGWQELDWDLWQSQASELVTLAGAIGDK